jgi:acetyl/propionyl-CoA carboxylase alpha subunit
MYERIAVESADHIAVLTINRPQVLNALDVPTLLELETAFERLERDDDVRVIIFTGAGDRAFDRRCLPDADAMTTTDFVMPKLGLTMTEGTVARWGVAPGSRFAAGDIIVVVETDKIAYDVEAPAPGVTRSWSPKAMQCRSARR